MINAEGFEKPQFSHNINAIPANHFPDQFPLHWHNYVEIAAVPENAKYEKCPIISINQEQFHLEPGDILFIWPGELHQINHNLQHQCIGLQFNSALLLDIPDFRPYINIFRSFHQFKQKEMPELTQHLMMYMQYILSLQKSNQKFPNVEAQIHLYEMFMEFATSREGSSSLLGSDKSRRKVQQACSFMEENCALPLSLDELANKVGFSPCYFSRIFKTATGYSFIEYLTLQRIKRAQALLTDPALSITEITFQAGFKSISTFNRVFQKQKGCSPSEYRKYYVK